MADNLVNRAVCDVCNYIILNESIYRLEGSDGPDGFYELCAGCFTKPGRREGVFHEIAPDVVAPMTNVMQQAQLQELKDLEAAGTRATQKVATRVQGLLQLMTGESDMPLTEDERTALAGELNTQLALMTLIGQDVAQMQDLVLADNPYRGKREREEEDEGEAEGDGKPKAKNQKNDKDSEDEHNHDEPSSDNKDYDKGEDEEEYKDTGVEETKGGK